jgi:hypothetical protein
VPVLNYTGKAGKAEVANLAYNIRLPDPDRSRQRIGYLITWSNDLLVELVRQQPMTSSWLVRFFGGPRISPYFSGHRPSSLWNAATWEISETLLSYLPIVKG